jgi:CO/xanthine dehydrogenase FAD-binding subunit
MVAAKSLEHAFSLLAEGWKPFAGGTDLMVLFEAGKLQRQRFVSIWGLAELKGIESADDSITLGALTTYTAVQADPILQAGFPLLTQAASETGGVATQNRGTLGGNIVNASPAADTPPALLVYDAELELVSASGTRWVPYSSFHTGYKKTLLRPDELVARIRMPRRNGWSQYYRKVGTRKAQAISNVCLAAAMRPDGGRVEARVALGSVAPTVVRCYETERAIEHDPRDIAGARAALAREIFPIDDIRSSAEYRLRVAANLLEDFLSAPA